MPRTHLSWAGKAGDKWSFELGLKGGSLRHKHVLLEFQRSWFNPTLLQLYVLDSKGFWDGTEG